MTGDLDEPLAEIDPQIFLYLTVNRIRPAANATSHIQYSGILIQLEKRHNFMNLRLISLICKLWLLILIHRSHIWMIFAIFLTSAFKKSFRLIIIYINMFASYPHSVTPFIFTQYLSASSINIFSQRIRQTRSPQRPSANGISFWIIDFRTSAVASFPKRI